MVSQVAQQMRVLFTAVQLLPSWLLEDRFPDHQAKLYTAEIVLAFSYLHTLNIVYRDLKPEVNCPPTSQGSS